MSRWRSWSAAFTGAALAASLVLATPAGASVIAPASPLNAIGRAVAQSLGTPAQRAWLVGALEASPYMEHRVPLRQLLRSAGDVAPYQAILRRTGLGGRTDATLAALPDLELYLPIEA